MDCKKYKDPEIMQVTEYRPSTVKLNKAGVPIFD